MQDYDPEYYAEESEDDGARYMPNYPPGAMFQQQAKAQPKQPAYGGVSSASGVPFYGQQNKPAFAAGGGFGAGGNPGGFTYGMAAKGGNLFGGGQQAAFGSQFGAAAPQNPGIFQFGSVSQFGGMGGAGMFGGASSAAPADDPYANIALDLNKVKKSEPPAKLYEHKTEEEKKTTVTKAPASTATAAAKSNLKKEAEPVVVMSEEDRKKKGVTFGKSTTYEVEAGEQDESGEYQTKDVHEGRKGSPRPAGDKKVIAEKDLSDGRSEKEKIIEMLEKQQREQLEEIREMNSWKEKRPMDESVGDSSSSNPPPPPKKSAEHSSGSYESDDFEDVSASASGSGSKSKMNWPPKPKESYDPSAMEAYLKK